MDYTKEIRLTTNKGRAWFDSYEDVKKKHGTKKGWKKGVIDVHCLVAGGDPKNPLDWVSIIG